MEFAIVLCVLAAAGSLAVVAGVLIAVVSSKGDIERVKRVVKAKRKERVAAKEHKKAMAEESEKVEEIAKEVEEVASAEEDSLDLQGLADKFNNR